MTGIREAFDFVDQGRTYSCRVDELRHGRPERWWWFGVTGDRSRYAAFRAEPGDTEMSVRNRMVTYYEDRVARRGWVDSRGYGTPSTRA